MDNNKLYSKIIIGSCGIFVIGSIYLRYKKINNVLKSNLIKKTDKNIGTIEIYHIKEIESPSYFGTNIGLMYNKHTLSNVIRRHTFVSDYSNNLYFDKNSLPIGIKSYNINQLLLPKNKIGSVLNNLITNINNNNGYLSIKYYTSNETIYYIQKDYTKNIKSNIFYSINNTSLHSNDIFKLVKIYVLPHYLTYIVSFIGLSTFIINNI